MLHQLSNPNHTQWDGSETSLAATYHWWGPFTSWHSQWDLPLLLCCACDPSHNHRAAWAAAVLSRSLPLSQETPSVSSGVIKLPVETSE